MDYDPGDLDPTLIQEEIDALLIAFTYAAGNAEKALISEEIDGLRIALSYAVQS